MVVEGKIEKNKYLNYDPTQSELLDMDPIDVGAAMTCYINNNFKKKDRLEAITTMLNTFCKDFCENELPTEKKKELYERMKALL